MYVYYIYRYISICIFDSLQIHAALSWSDGRGGWRRREGGWRGEALGT